MMCTKQHTKVDSPVCNQANWATNNELILCTDSNSLRREKGRPKNSCIRTNMDIREQG